MSDVLDGEFSCSGQSEPVKKGYIVIIVNGEKWIGVIYTTVTIILSGKWFKVIYTSAYIIISDLEW